VDIVIKKTGPPQRRKESKVQLRACTRPMRQRVRACEDLESRTNHRERAKCLNGAGCRWGVCEGGGLELGGSGVAMAIESNLLALFGFRV